MTVPFASGDVTILCCPEDRQCQNIACSSGTKFCEKCRIPLCRECASSLHDHTPKMPPAALVNDMMIFYAPRELYLHEMTVMEMICCSVCITSMICFSLEVKYGNMLDSKIHMHRHRVGARGNVTSFPMPWQTLLAELQRLDVEQSKRQEPDLPHTGQDLANVVQILLKSSDEETRGGLSRYIHQARVRRAVVVEAILSAKRRQHRAYLLFDEMHEKAKALPQDGVPPELVRLLGHDSDLDKVQIQKAATPVEGRRQNLEETAAAFAVQRPNAVVMEKSSTAEADINAQRIHAVRTLAEDLAQQPTMELKHVEERTQATMKAPGVTNSDSSQKLPTAKTLATYIDDAWKYLLSYAVQTYLQHTVETKAVATFASKTVSLEETKAFLCKVSEFRHSSLHRFALETGNTMIDQFEPWYFGVAFAFCFKYCTGMPDMPAWAQKPRYRRSEDAPRIEAPLWIKVIA